jgi:hypothetical protein
LEDGEYERLLRKAYQAVQYDAGAALREALAAPWPRTRRAKACPTAAPIEGNNGKARRCSDESQQVAGATRRGGPDEWRRKPDGFRSRQNGTELVRDELEQRLATTAPVTSDELRSLMQQRIEVVQKFLVDSAGIAAERLLSSAPNPEDPIGKERRGQYFRSIELRALARYQTG